VVFEFRDVFLEELLGLPLQREIDFETELVPDPNLSLKPHIAWPQQSLEN